MEYSSLEPKLLYWTGALINFCAVIACGVVGWWAIRRERLELHRRSMNAAIFLVILFVVSYVLKVIFLGREDLGTWSTVDLTILRIHEALVLVMVVAGGVARFRARRLDLDSAPERRARHRGAGRTAVVAGLLALLTAGLVLLGMFLR